MPKRISRAVFVALLLSLPLCLWSKPGYLIRPFRSLKDPVRLDPRAVSQAPEIKHEGLCRLCADDPGVPIVHLTEADADSIGQTIATFNQSLLAHADSLLQAGTFGRSDGRDAKRQAHLLARMLSVNSLHYMVEMSTDPDVVYEANEATLKKAFEEYSDPGVYPIIKMVRGRMGMGQVCVRYDLSEDLQTEIKVGTQKLRIRIQETEFEGKPRRMLIMDLPTILFSTVEVLLDEHFTARSELIRSPGPPGPYDLFLFYDMTGLSVRKWGVHKPNAMMFWSTPRDISRTKLPSMPLVGSCVYVPGVQLELPSFLPDVGFEDLRAVDLPQPILGVSYIDDKAYPKWLRRGSVRGFKDWETHGPIPPDLRIRFPDL